MTRAETAMRHALDELRGAGDTTVAAGVSARLIAFAIACACGTLLGVAAWLNPDPTGIGTHTQLGLTSCLWPDRVGMPCPTCGMTTAFAHAAEGRIHSAFFAQPMGALLAVLTGMTFWLALYIAVTGSLVGHLLFKLWRPAIVWVIGGFALLSWLFKVWIYLQENPW